MSLKIAGLLTLSQYILPLNIVLAKIANFGLPISVAYMSISKKSSYCEYRIQI
jgi:hypothetical protein